MPEDFGVAEILEAEVEDWIRGVFRPGCAAVAAGGEVLGLFVLRGSGVDGDEAAGGLLAGVSAEAAGVSKILDGGSAEDGHAVLFGERDGELLPVGQVGRDRVAPTHVSPLIA